MKRTYIPRQVATNRQPAVARLPAIGRRLIASPSNGKLNVILDTNILFARLLAEAKEHADSAPYQIIEELKIDIYNLIQPQNLFDEYKYELYRLAVENNINRYNIDLLLDLIQKKAYYGRTLVMPIIMPSDIDDAAVFNTSLIGCVNYVVTKDSRDLIKKKIPNVPTKIEIIGPNAFLQKLHRYCRTLS